MNFYLSNLEMSSRTKKSLSGPRKKSTKSKKSDDEEPPTKKQKGIDMSHVPASLLNEGNSSKLN